jgi:hypothetical protein
MTELIHQNLADGRWQTMTLTEQLANVGSEFERAWSWRAKGQKQLAENATDRMLELLDLTITDPRWRGPKLRELTRLREAMCEEWFKGGNSAPKDLSKYFLNFAMWARGGIR